MWIHNYIHLVHCGKKGRVVANTERDVATWKIALVVIFINLEHISCPTLVLLFKLRKGKYWLEGRRQHFVKNNTAMLTYTQICSSLINSKIILWSRHINFNLKSIEIEKLFP